MVTRNQIVNGVIKYAKNEVINKITDKPLKMMLAAGVSALEINNSIADKIFQNDFVSKILNEDAGMYDIDSAVEILEKTIDEYGDFPVVIPAIKFLSPNEKELTFTSRDIRKLKGYIIGGMNDD